MRVILDTNVLISALLHPLSDPARLVGYWEDSRFKVLSCEEQVSELRRVTRLPKILPLISPPVAGRLINGLRQMGHFIDRLPQIDISPDPWDNYLLALAQAGQADFLVTGDKRDLLALGHHGRTVITTVRAFLDRL